MDIAIAVDYFPAMLHNANRGSSWLSVNRVTGLEDSHWRQQATMTKLNPYLGRLRTHTHHLSGIALRPARVPSYEG